MDFQLPSKQRTFSQISITKQFPGLFKDSDERFSSEHARRPRTVKARQAHSQKTNESQIPSIQPSIHETPLKSAYNPLSRVFTSPVLGEIKLPKTGFQLAEGARMGSVFTIKAQKLMKPAMQSVEQLECFKKLKEDITPYDKSKPNFKKCLRRSLKELKNLQVSSADSLRLESIICKKPYDKPFAHEFIKACKEGNYSEVERLIMRNRFIVHVFDCMQMTGLHWAVMRNHFEVIKLLLLRKAFVDAIDLVGARQSHRTPLHIASRLNMLEAIKLLLSARADPYIRTSGKKLPIKLTTHSQVYSLLHKAMLVIFTQINSLIWAAPKEKREEIWRTEGVNLE